MKYLKIEWDTVEHHSATFEVPDDFDHDDFDWDNGLAEFESDADTLRGVTRQTHAFIRVGPGRAGQAITLNPNALEFL